MPRPFFIALNFEGAFKIYYRFFHHSSTTPDIIFLNFELGFKIRLPRTQRT